MSPWSWNGDLPGHSWLHSGTAIKDITVEWALRAPEPSHPGAKSTPGTTCAKIDQCYVRAILALFAGAMLKYQYQARQCTVLEGERWRLGGIFRRRAAAGPGARRPRARPDRVFELTCLPRHLTGRAGHLPPVPGFLGRLRSRSPFRWAPSRWPGTPSGIARAWRR